MDINDLRSGVTLVTCCSSSARALGVDAAPAQRFRRAAELPFEGEHEERAGP